MKKIPVLLFMILSICVFTNCNTTKKAAQPAVPEITYAGDIKSLIELRCSPCHIPAKGGRKESLDTYLAVKENIDDVIRRIELNPEDKGFMPFKHPKLSAEEINKFKSWKTGGFKE